MRLAVLIGALAVTTLVGCAPASSTNDPSVAASPADIELASPNAQLERSFEELVSADLASAVGVIQGWWPGFTAPNLRTIALGETSGGVMTGCGRYPFTSGNAFYCPGDNTVYLDLNFLAAQERGGAESGAALAITAHELGHAWEAQRGYRIDDGDTVVKTELFADCISGAIVAGMGANEEAAARDAFSSGDFAFDNPQHHGTPSQRRQATLTGIEQGHEVCDAYLR